MSSLPLLDKPIATESVTLTCTPAVVVLLVGIIVVIFDIFNKSPQNAGLHLLITILLTVGVLILCFMGLKEVGSLIVLLPIVIFAGIVIIIVLALMIGEKYEPEPIDIPEPSVIKPDKKKERLDCAYKYVMTGKGFGKY